MYVTWMLWLGDICYLVDALCRCCKHIYMFHNTSRMLNMQNLIEN